MNSNDPIPAEVLPTEPSETRPFWRNPVWLRGARNRAFIAGGLLLAVGAALAFVPKPSAVKRTETWVADALPKRVGDFSMMPPQDPKYPYCSYKMDKTTYDILRPWGIVPRVFSNGRNTYDVVVIGSNTKDSFHDPSVCFSAQGWNLSNERIETVNTKSQGAVPVTMVDMDHNAQKTIAMYFYRLREGYVGSNTGVKKQMLFYKLKELGKDDEGGFIRIIPSGNNPKPEDLKSFAAAWIDAAAKSSGGYY